ncbi:MAG: hypothetical protein Kow00124_04620 [Anaerolineae bacterium]
MLTERRLLIGLLIVFVIAASLYSIITPPFEMSDEVWHYPMVKRLADGEGLVVQDPANVGPWRQEGSQAPLYYYLGAALTFWIDTDDMPEVRRENPHVDNGLITEDGNNNLVVHDYASEAWPWRGTVLAVHLVRFFSVLLGAAAVYLTYLIGVEVFPERRWLGLAAAAAMAFTPMFAFISGAVNNDNLAVPLSALAVWLMIRMFHRSEEGQPTLRWSILLGMVLGLAALTKVSTLGLFGLAGITMAVIAYRRKRWQTFFIEGPLIIAIAAAIAGWWYVRNQILYGDPLGNSAFIAILGQRARPASLAQLWTERQGFMMSYWGLFGGVNVPMDGWIYTVLNGLFVVSMAGAVVTLALRARREGIGLKTWMAPLLTLLWIASVVVPLSGSWARTTWSSQGRLVFYALSALSLWFVAGLGAWLPERIGRVVVGIVLGFMGAITLAAPLIWIRPAYTPPPQAPAPPEPLQIDFTPPGAEQPAMRLLAYDVQTDQVQPGGVVYVTLTWEALAPMDRRWSVFIHLADSTGLLAGQRDTYPGVGLLATTDLEPGRRWVDRYAVPVLEGAYAPETLEVLLGLYDYTTCPACQRMRLASGADSLRLGTVTLAPRDEAAGIPNPVSVNFGGEIELIGYSLSTRQAAPGETIELTLHWRALRQMTRDYTISAQVLGDDTTRYAQEDSWPLNGARPTTTWAEGEIVEDAYTLTLRPDTPPGVYWVQVVVYWAAPDGSFERLQRITADGRLTDDFILLTRVRVGVQP